MYLRDPAGNLVEVNWPDASSLDRSVVTVPGGTQCPNSLPPAKIPDELSGLWWNASEMTGFSSTRASTRL